VMGLSVSSLTKPLSGDRYIDGMLQGSFWDAETLVFSMSDGWRREVWNAPDQMASEFLSAAYQMTRYTALDGQWLGFFDDPLAAYEAAPILISPLTAQRGIQGSQLGPGIPPNSHRDTRR
jgi:hypothetical protein